MDQFVFLFFHKRGPHSRSKKKINLINARLNKMFDMLLDGELEETFYNKKRDEFQDEIDSLNAQLTNLNNSTIDILKFSRKTLELFKKTPLLYLNGDIETKRELIKLACSNLLYDGKNLTIIIKEAFQPIVEIASLINGGPPWTRTRDLTLIRGAL